MRVIPISDSHNDYAERLRKQLHKLHIRVEADLESDRMNAKIRKAQLMKVPYMLVVGDKEVEQETVALRKRDGTQQNALPFNEFLGMLQEKIATRSAEL